MDTNSDPRQPRSRRPTAIRKKEEFEKYFKFITLYLGRYYIFLPILN